MSTQDSGGTPHTCKAVEHCHTLNERVSDLEGWLRLVDGATQAVSARLTELDESASHWHNTLARESRAHHAQLAALVPMVEAHAKALDAHREVIDSPDRDRAAARRSAVVHCSTCTCGATR